MHLRMNAAIRGLAVTGLVAALAGPATAAWSSSLSGSAYARAKTIGTQAAPTATLGGTTGNRKVTVTWSDSGFIGGGKVNSFLVARYDAASGAKQTIGAACSGLITATSCTESKVPSGSWQYTITPAIGNWRGSESPRSNTVTVP
jgi:hypothetical protein